MPTTRSPCLAYLSCQALSLGRLALHGPHQVAQNSTTTTLPLSDESLGVCGPETALRSNVGAFLSTRRERMNCTSSGLASSAKVTVTLLPARSRTRVTFSPTPFSCTLLI